MLSTLNAAGCDATRQIPDSKLKPSSIYDVLQLSRYLEVYIINKELSKKRTFKQLVVKSRNFLKEVKGCQNMGFFWNLGVDLT